MKAFAIEPLEARIAPATITIAPASIVEGDSDNTIQFKVTSDTPIVGTANVHFSTSDATGHSGVDYTGISDDILTFNDGETEKFITVHINGNMTAEIDRTFSVVLSNPDSALSLGNSSATGTIIDDDRTVKINSVQVDEGDSGTKDMVFRVSLGDGEPVATHDIVVNVTVADGTATHTGNGKDYDASAITQTITIPAGSTFVDLPAVKIFGDTNYGGDENFTITLTSVVGGTAKLSSQTVGTGTIKDDDFGRPKPTLSISGPSGPVAEPAAGATANANFTFTLSGGLEQDVNIFYSTGDTDDTALPPNGNFVGDYTPQTNAGGTALVIAAGSTTQTVAVPIIHDNVAEHLEQFTMKIDSASLANGGGAVDLGTVKALATIAADPLPTLSISDAKVVEGNSGDSFAHFTVTLSQPSDQDVTFLYHTAGHNGANGATGGGADYDDVSDTLVTIHAGDTSASFDIKVKGDTVIEPDEFFHVVLSNPTGATITKADGLGTIQNDDTLFSITSGGLHEVTTSETTKTISFNVHRNDGTGAASVRVVAKDGTDITGERGAKGGPNGDFALLDQIVSFAAGETDKTVTVMLQDDTTYEGNERFTVELSAPDAVNGQPDPTSSSVLVHLTDNDAAPTLSIANASALEGGKITFTVTLSNRTEIPASVFYYTTVNGTGEFDAATGDFTGIPEASAIKLDFNGSSLVQTFTIDTTVDNHVERNETFGVHLKDASVGTITKADATGTIINDDIAKVTITAPPSVKEGHDAQGNAVATQNLNFTVTVDKPVDYDFDIGYGTANDIVATTATVGSDYQSTSGSLHFTAADFANGTASKTITVLTYDDKVQESDETFLVKLSGSDPGLQYTSSQAKGTILNDDLGVHVSNVTVQEGNSGLTTVLFTVSLDRSLTAGQSVTLNYATHDGTATADTTLPDNLRDYISKSGSLTFAAGETVKTVAVQVKGDTVSEGQDAAHLFETFTLDLSGAKFTAATGGTAEDRDLSQTSGTATIVDDDVHSSVVSVVAANATVDEGAASATPHTATFNVNLTTALQHDVKVSYKTSLTTTGGVPAESDIMTVIVPAGSKTIPVTVNYDGNDVVGHDQIAQVTITGTEIVLGTGQSDATTLTTSTTAKTAQTIILDDDATLTISAPSAVTEGAAGTTTAARFTVTLSAAVDHDVVVNISTADGTATASTSTVTGDYVGAAAGSKVTIKAGQTTGTFDVTVIGDNLPGQDETFTATLATPVGAKLATSNTTGTATIKDDDTSVRGTPQLTIQNATGVEGGKASFVVKLSQASDSAVTVNFHTEDLTGVNAAIGGTDYTAISGTPLVIAPGATSATIDVTLTDDAANEAAETFALKIDSVTNATTATPTLTATGTIQASDLVSLKFDNLAPRLVEGNADTSMPTVKVTLDKAATNPVTFTVTSVDGTAKSTGATPDFLALNQKSFTIDAGQTSIDVPISVFGDGVNEGDETFTLSLALDSTQPAVLAPNQAVATATIANDDVYIAFKTGSITVDEGAGFARVVVQRVDPFTSLPITAGKATVHYATQTGTATDGTATNTNVDFRKLVGDVTFADGQSEVTISIPIEDDKRHEGPESFSVVLSNPTNGVLGGQSTATVTITDNDAVPTIAISTPKAIIEGNNGTKNLVFTVTLNQPDDLEAVTVNYATLDGTAIAGADYTAQTGTITFAKGEQTKTITIPIISDLTYDSAPRETFGLKLTLPTPGTASFAGGGTDLTGTGTIIDDDVAPVVSLAAASGVEGSNLGFVASLSHPSDRPITVTYYTTEGTAKSGDFGGVAKSAGQTLTFAPGETSKQIVVATTQDTIAEQTETFQAHLGSLVTPRLEAKLNPRASAATGTIIDEDQVFITINDTTIQEGDSGTTNAVFHVSLSNPSSTPVTVKYSTVNGTAMAGSDFIARTGTLIIPAGADGGDIIIPVKGDMAEEYVTVADNSTTPPTPVKQRQETFTVELSDAKNGTLANHTGTGTILDEDNKPTLSISNQFVTEGNSGTKTMSFLPTLSSIATTDVTFTVSTAAARAVVGAAQAGSDYVATSRTFTIKAGDLVPKASGADDPFKVTINGDGVFENTEQFQVRITNVQGAQAGDLTAVGTIYNDDIFASARMVKWTDIDGELVTLTTSRGSLLNAGFNFDTTSNATYGGRTLTQLNVSSQEFLHANITITSSAQPGFPTAGVTQDGLVNVGLIRSNDATSLTNLLEVHGVDLGVITVEGDLNSFVVGDMFTDPALAALNVKSIGKVHQGDVSIAIAAITSMNVTGDVWGNINVTGGEFAYIKNLKIGGALNGVSSQVVPAPTSANSNATAPQSGIGVIFAKGGIRSADIGSIIGGAGDNTGVLSANGTLNGLTTVLVRDSVIGGAGANSGLISSNVSINTISVHGSVTAGTGSGSGMIFANQSLNTAHIFGDLDNRTGPTSGNLVKPGAESGTIVAGTIKSLTIDGSVYQGRIAASGGIDSLTIGGNLEGTTARAALIVAGGVSSDFTMKSIVVKGSASNAQILGGYIRDVQTNGVDVLYSPVNADAQIGTVDIGGTVQALDIVAGVMAGEYTPASGSATNPVPRSFGDNMFGTIAAVTDDPNADRIITDVGLGLIDNANVSSRIAQVIFRGAVMSAPANHGIVAQQVDSVSVAGDLLPLTILKDFIDVAPNTNFKVLEVIA